VATWRNKRISVWLTAIAVLALFPSGVRPADIANTNYASQAGGEDDAHLHSLGEYLAGGTMDDSLLGVTLREDSRKLKTGTSPTGLLIVAVTKGSPAANAGLAAIQEAPKQVATAIAIAGSMVFPPAVLLWPVAEALPIGRDGDLIIAVDGSRVRNLLEFENATRHASAGEIVYLTIVRRGLRKQVPVPIPGTQH